ncbi:MAG: acriflavine resistance protein B [Phycisphaeraceae bacterium]|nr:MAG: acriflavine resistance protein B [Phycisphaeraceae bacterium]
MDIVKFSIAKPVTVTVGVILLVMFGLIGLTRIPVQLTPSVDRPIINVTTTWPGRSPEEVVDEIVKEQEEELKNVSNLKRMKSVSSEGSANIELEFYIGASMPRALQEVSDALRQVSDYPEEVQEPQIKAADGASENAIAWIIIDVDPAVVDQYPDFDVSTLFDPLDKEVKPYMERIDGVAEVNVYGGREREARIYADSFALAQRELSHADVVQALRRENRNVSAGTIAEGKRDYRVRLIGQYETPEQIEETVVAYRDGLPVYVKDVATVEIGYQKRRGFVRSLGHPSIAMNVIRQSNANVVDVMDQVRARLDEVRTDILPNIAPPGHAEVGPHLRIRQVYDETTYIDSAMGLVTSNLFIGGALAGVVLMVFLRSITSTAIIALAIPISIIGTFLVMLGLGRTLNVVSLAGLAFAVGMVVDNAIVVLENIYRRLQNGEQPMRAAYLGGKEVWGAILASTLTTAAVFIPVLTIQEEAGQLFRDISLAVVGSVLLSLVISVTVIPAAASRWLRTPNLNDPGRKRGWRVIFFGIDWFFGSIASGFANAIHWLMTGWRAWTLRPAVIVVMTVASLGGAVLLMPPLDYLPAGNRNLVFGGLLAPPGLSVDQFQSMAERVEVQIKPYLDASLEAPSSYQDLAPIPRMGMGADGKPHAPFEPVPVDNFFIGSFGGGMFVGGTSEMEETVIPIGQLLTNAMMNLPDSFGGARQSSLFGRGVGGGNTVNLEISGPDLDRVTAAADMMYGLGGQLYGFGSGVTADPGNFNLNQQEYRLVLNDRARALGITNEAVAPVVRGLFDGAFAGDYRLSGDTIDLVVLPVGGRLDYKEQLASVPVATPSGRVVPIDTIVDIIPSLAPQSVQRIEELPAVTLLFQPPEGMTVEELQHDIEANVIGPARSAGMIDRTMRIRLEGTAAKLDEVRAAMFGKAAEGGPDPILRKASLALVALLTLGGLGVAGFAGARAVKRGSARDAYAVIGALILVAAIGFPLLALGAQPQLIMARMVWALIVTYLLMCALFESFIYPLVIMFTVPLAVVGGFAGLAIVHAWSLADPTKAPQQLDVLTMLGFVILIGVVVNNAILLVHQSLNFMRGIGESEDDAVETMPPLEAIRESVRTRIRPIFMSVLTSVGGMLPLILFPGPGSEMYRGLGSVVVGGLLVSTIFTLLLVPLVFSLTLQSVEALRSVFGIGNSVTTGFGPPRPPTPAVATTNGTGKTQATEPAAV